MQLLQIITIVLSITSILSTIIFVISLWKIFEKEGFKPYYSIIPFVNIYYYFKICKLPFWTIFIPLVNIVVLACSTYRIAFEYKQKKSICILGIFFPFIVLPMIAFSDAQNKRLDKSTNPFKTLLEIDNLENKLSNNYDFENIDFIENEDFNPDNNDFISNTDNMINEIEQNSISDEYFFEEDFDIPEEVTPPVEEVIGIPTLDDTEEELVELFESDPNSLTTAGIEELENKMQAESQIKRVDNANYKEYETIGPSSEAIAFGGEKQIENANAAKAKTEELKCPRCGSSLIGANDYCPGCGSKL